MTQYLLFIDPHLSERMAHESRTDTSFADALDEFKRRGSNLLVVGPPSDRARAAICRRLLGDASAGTRRRLFVETDGTASCLDDCDGPITPETTRLVTRTTPTRSASATDRSRAESGVESPAGTETPATPTDPTAADVPATATDPTAADTAGTATADSEDVSGSSGAITGEVARRHVTETGLATLACAINTEIGVFADRADSLDPAELRLCFDSLTPLVAGNDTVAVRRFLHAITARVRSCRGMAHYHLAAGRRDDVVVELAPAFDAVIELRIDDDRPEQRWHVPDRDLHTDWLPL
jgi:hypothetical protein